MEEGFTGRRWEGNVEKGCRVIRLMNIRRDGMLCCQITNHQ